MPVPFLRPALAIVATIGLGACSTYGYDDYSGVRVSAGYGAGNYSPYYGWYDDYYYPGTGYHVWDRGGYRHAWSDRQRRYWMARRAGHRQLREHWNGYRYKRRGDYVHRDQRRYRDHRDRRDRHRYRDQRRAEIERERQRERARADQRRIRDLREQRRDRIEQAERRVRAERDQRRQRSEQRRGNRQVEQQQRRQRAEREQRAQQRRQQAEQSQRAERREARREVRRRMSERDRDD